MLILSFKQIGKNTFGQRNKGEETTKNQKLKEAGIPSHIQNSVPGKVIQLFWTLETQSH